MSLISFRSVIVCLPSQARIGDAHKTRRETPNAEAEKQRLASLRAGPHVFLKPVVSNHCTGINLET